MVEAKGYEIRGIAPSAQAASVLGKELGIDTCTVDRLLLSEIETGHKPQLWIVDEAGMLGAQNAFRLLQKAEGVGARVLLTGDTRQLSAVAAGNPFASLQRSGMATAQMVQSKRQRVPELVESVQLAAAGQPQAALNRLIRAERLQVHADMDALREQVAREYLSLSPVERETTQMVVGTNEERRKLTERIRQGLQEEGRLGHDVAAMAAAGEGFDRHPDGIFPLHECRGCGGTGVGAQETGFRAGGAVYRRREARGRAVVTGAGRSRASGGGVVLPQDHLRTNRDAAGGGGRTGAGRRTNGERVGATDSGCRWRRLKGTEALVQWEDGRLEYLDLTQPLHADNNLVATAYRSQGETADRVLLVDDGSLDKESFYVGISRSRYDLQVHTADRERLFRQVVRSRANENPIDLLKERWAVEADEGDFER